MNISPAAKHNLMNVVIILLPTILIYVVYYLGGGDFSRGQQLAATTALGFILSFFAFIGVHIERGGWK